MPPLPFSLAVASLVLWCWYYRTVCARLPRLHFKQTPFNTRLVVALSILRRPYAPTPFLAFPLLGGHLQTILSAFYKVAPDIRYEREIFIASDKATVAIDWARKPATGATDEGGVPIVVVLHGLTGGSHESYVRIVVHEVMCAHPEWGVVALNYRGCADTPLTSRKAYCAGFTSDLRMVSDTLRRRYPSSPLLGVGFSLGANIFTKMVGEANSPYAALVAVANPFDLQESTRHIHKPVNHVVYNRQLCANLKNVFEKHHQLYKDDPAVDMTQLRDARTVREFDERFTRRIFGYPTVDTYYRHASSVNYLGGITTPVMFLNAEDDPISAKTSLPHEECEANPFTLLVTTKYGGHLGHFETMACKRWFAPVCVEYFDAVLSLRKEFGFHRVESDALWSHPTRPLRPNEEMGPFDDFGPGFDIDVDASRKSGSSSVERVDGDSASQTPQQTKSRTLSIAPVQNTPTAHTPQTPEQKVPSPDASSAFWGIAQVVAVAGTFFLLSKVANRRS